MKFGEFLISNNLINEQNLSDAIEVQKHTKQKIGRILRDLGVLSQYKLNSALELFLNPKIDASFEELVNEIEKTNLQMGVDHFSI